MGCCASNLKLDMNRSAVYASKRSRSNSYGSNNSNSNNSSNNNSSSNNNNNNNSSGFGRSIWSRSQTRPICDDFAEQPLETEMEPELELELERSCGYYTCSSAASTPSKQQLRRTQDMELANHSQSEQSNCDESTSENRSPAVGNLEWEMYMMQRAQRIMPKTSSPIGQRRDIAAAGALNSRSYHKWRNYLQSTPAHMLHNVSHIPEAIAGHFCPTDFPAFTDLEEMESAAKRFKVDRHESFNYPEPQPQHLTHTISTDL